MKTLSNPLLKFDTYIDIKTAMSQQAYPIVLNGCVDSQKAHFIPNLGEDFPCRFVLTYKEEKAKELGVTPMATWVAGALGGVEPEIMGVGPVASTRKVFERTGLTIDDMDLVEANEAFAAQSIAVARDLNFDMSKVNVNGGAIALGHPVGASGCRILVTLLHEMQKRPEAKRGLATLCIGGGMGCSTIVEKD